MVGGGCAKPPVPLAQLPVPEVTVETPVARDVQETYETTGRIAAVDVVQVLPRVSGHIVEVAFRDGQKVKAGDVLFRIDPRPFEAALAQARAQVELEQARVLKTGADLARQEDLFKKKVATKQDLDLAIAERDSAVAMKAQAEAKVDSAKLDLDFATITAPIAGKTSTASVKVGALVGTVSATPSPLTTITSITPVHVYFNVDERTVLRIRELMTAEGRAAEIGGAEVRKANMPVTIRLENPSMKPITGVMDFVDNQVNPQTGTIRVRAEFGNDPEILNDGMFVRVSMPVGKPRPALLVPERALLANLGNKFVFVVDGDGKAKALTVVPGLKQGPLVEAVAAEGGAALATDSRVIVAGLQRVRDGAPVKADVAAAPPPGSTSPQGDASPPSEAAAPSGNAPHKDK